MSFFSRVNPKQEQREDGDGAVAAEAPAMTALGTLSPSSSSNPSVTPASQNHTLNAQPLPFPPPPLRTQTDNVDPPSDPPPIYQPPLATYTSPNATTNYLGNHPQYSPARPLDVTTYTPLCPPPLYTSSSTAPPRRAPGAAPRPNFMTPLRNVFPSPSPHGRYGRRGRRRAHFFSLISLLALIPLTVLAGVWGKWWLLAPCVVLLVGGFGYAFWTFMGGLSGGNGEEGRRPPMRFVGGFGGSEWWYQTRDERREQNQSRV